VSPSGDVSRETPAPPPPASAQVVFGPRLGAAIAYADLLAGPGVLRGLIGPREVPRLWERHLVNCAVVGSAPPPSGRVVDVGSGAGLPGLVWALLRPDLEIVLLEPMLRRAEFLVEAVAALGLTTVTVDRSRAEDARGRLAADVVTARAVAPLDRLLGLTLPLVRPGGRLLAFKGRTAGAELAASADTLSTAWATARLTTYGEGVLDPPATVVEVTVRSDTSRPPGGRGREESRGRRSRDQPPERDR
jgi:16S rRNA (guanine527-N7)-methyltransferase